MTRGENLARTTAVVCVVLAAGAAALWPGRWRVPLGVIGGGLLVGLSAWAIRGAVDGVLGRVGPEAADAGAGTGEGRPSGLAVLVKFFTRHAILALAAYGMMVRLHLDPVGMLVGVSSLVVAAAIDALRRLQRVS